MYQTDLIYQYSGRSIEKLFCFLTKLHNTQPDFYPVSWVCSSWWCCWELIELVLFLHHQHYHCHQSLTSTMLSILYLMHKETCMSLTIFLWHILSKALCCLCLPLWVIYLVKTLIVAMAADSLLCGCWVDHGTSYGLEFSAFRDSHPFHDCHSCGLHVAGLPTEKTFLV